MRTHLLLLIGLVSSPAFAVLGEIKSSDLVTKEKCTVHEFAGGGSGKVYAVAWSGQAHPNFHTLLGTKYAAFVAAVKRAKQTHKGHAPVTIEDEGLHIELAGGMRTQSGRVWILDQMPKEVKRESIR